MGIAPRILWLRRLTRSLPQMLAYFAQVDEEGRGWWPAGEYAARCSLGRRQTRVRRRMATTPPISRQNGDQTADGLGQ
jgi:hypothetical protein